MQRLLGRHLDLSSWDMKDYRTRQRIGIESHLSNNVSDMEDIWIRFSNTETPRSSKVEMTRATGRELKVIHPQVDPFSLAHLQHKI